MLEILALFVGLSILRQFFEERKAKGEQPPKSTYTPRAGPITCTAYPYARPEAIAKRQSGVGLMEALVETRMTLRENIPDDWDTWQKAMQTLSPRQRELVIRRYLHAEAVRQRLSGTKPAGEVETVSLTKTA